nr:zinc finger, CCHC-type [Tanacetum cinerariifolium]
MSHALQKQFESYPPQLMVSELKKMFEKSHAVEIYDLVDALHSCKQAPGKSVSAHVLEMKGYMDQLHALGKSYDNDMAINLINRSLNKEFGDFVRNFTMHCGFKEERKLSYGEQYLQVCNGAQAAVEAIRVFDLVLPSGLVMKLNNCYYTPSIVRGVVSLSCLLDLGFNHTITSTGISVSLNGLFYFSAVSVNGTVLMLNILLLKLEYEHVNLASHLPRACLTLARAGFPSSLAGNCNDSFFGIDIVLLLPVASKPVELLTFGTPV